MVLVGFLQAQNCTTLASSWRHPESRSDFTDAPIITRRSGACWRQGSSSSRSSMIGWRCRTCYGGDHAHTVENGIRCVKMDPVTVLMAMAAGDRAAGAGIDLLHHLLRAVPRGAACSPTVDLMTGGRAAWNVVTSVNDGEAREYGPRRSTWSTTFATTAPTSSWKWCWATGTRWEDDALVVDKSARAVRAIADKVHRLDHQGRFFRSRGPFTVPRSAQGHPVLIQAGLERARQAVRGALGGDGVRRPIRTSAWRSGTMPS